MITLVEALNYRCLRYVQRPMQSLHVLVGPNASGKTTFLDVIGFLSDLVSEGLEAALSKRSPVPEELLFARQGDRMELAVETQIPVELRELTSKPDLDTIRYEVVIGFDEVRRGFEFKGERLLLKKTKVLAEYQRSIFPMPPATSDSLLTNIRGRETKVVINKVQGETTIFTVRPTAGRAEVGCPHSNWAHKGQPLVICWLTPAISRLQPGSRITWRPVCKGLYSTAVQSRGTIYVLTPGP